MPPDDDISGAERRLIQALQSDFGDDFVVFWHVKWMKKRRRGGALEGEADFVIAHPNYGALVLEVKDGGDLLPSPFLCCTLNHV